MQNFEETWSSAVRRHSVSAAVFLSGLCRLHQSIADSFSPRQAHPRRRRGIGQSTMARPPAHRGPVTPRKVTAWPRSPAAAPASSQDWAGHARAGTDNLARRRPRIVQDLSSIDRSIAAIASTLHAPVHTHTCRWSSPAPPRVTRPSRPTLAPGYLSILPRSDLHILDLRWTGLADERASRLRWNADAE